MILLLDEVLKREQALAMAESLHSGSWVGGSQTASGPALEQKQNQEIDRRTELHRALAASVGSALLTHGELKEAVLPGRIFMVIFSRYDPGMSYGWHVDSPLMQENGELYRSDLSFTLFLSEPESYRGGELVLDGEYGEFEHKGGLGDAIVYPTTVPHRVNEVTEGTRLVAVGWIQSRVREAAKREILYDLRRGRTSIAYDNLLRLWIEL